MSSRRQRGSPLFAGTLALAATGLVLALGAAPSAGAGPSAGAPPSFRILAPTENAALLPGEAVVIGATAGDGAVVLQVAVDGKLAKLATAARGGFRCTLSLSPGRHAIRVSSGKDEATVSVSVSSSGEYRYHPQVEKCEGCHAGPAGPFRPDVPLPGLCGKCHKPRNRGKFVHGPVAVGGCTACHDPHGAPNPHLQKAALTCFACHQPFPAAAQVHEPVKRGACGACHDPHSADDRALLVTPGNALCLTCHRDSHPYHRGGARQGSMARVPEDFPLDKGLLACAGCHAAHQSNEKRLLRVAEDRLCRMCHD